MAVTGKRPTKRTQHPPQKSTGKCGRPLTAPRLAVQRQVRVGEEELEFGEWCARHSSQDVLDVRPRPHRLHVDSCIRAEPMALKKAAAA